MGENIQNLITFSFFEKKRIVFLFIFLTFSLLHLCQIFFFFASYSIIISFFPLLTDLQDQHAKERALQSLASMSSAQIVSASAIHNKASNLATAYMPPGSEHIRPPYGATPQVSFNPFLNSHWLASRLVQPITAGRYISVLFPFRQAMICVALSAWINSY